MSKELTEQWREGTLEEGCYYIRWSFNIDDEPSYMVDFYDRENFAGGEFVNKRRKFIDEVMCSVPSYHDLCELKQELEICKEEKADLYAKLCNALTQLDEANKLIKEFVKPEPLCILCTEETEKLPESNEIKVAKEYIERYGVK